MDTAEERISEPKDKSLENIQSKAQKDLSEKKIVGLQSTGRCKQKLKAKYLEETSRDFLFEVI